MDVYERKGRGTKLGNTIERIGGQIIKLSSAISADLNLHVGYLMYPLLQVPCYPMTNSAISP